MVAATKVSGQIRLDWPVARIISVISDGVGVPPVHAKVLAGPLCSSISPDPVLPDSISPDSTGISAVPSLSSPLPLQPTIIALSSIDRRHAA